MTTRLQIPETRSHNPDPISTHSTELRGFSQGFPTAAATKTSPKMIWWKHLKFLSGANLCRTVDVIAVALAAEKWWRRRCDVEIWRPLPSCSLVIYHPALLWSRLSPLSHQRKDFLFLTVYMAGGDKNFLSLFLLWHLILINIGHALKICNKWLWNWLNAGVLLLLYTS